MKILIILGTRPEAIKMAPIVHQLKVHKSNFKSIVCVTGQHREMLNQILNLFQIVPDYDLNIMSEGQNLFEITTKALIGLSNVLSVERPDLVLVQGDTTTSFAGSLAAYYLKIPVGHIEAGLRTNDKYNPFPEEKNRHLTSALADFHFSPTEWAKSNLLRENVPSDRIWVTGNTVIDALLTIIKDHKNKDVGTYWFDYFFNNWNLRVSKKKQKLILVTGHRRESFGEGLKNICLALKEIAERNPEVAIVYPVHLNPNVQQPVYDILGPLQRHIAGYQKDAGSNNIFLIEPLEYSPFIFLMKNAYLVLTDSGGIQEEAPSLGKPVLVMRNTTERPEGIEAGTTILVGTKTKSIVQATEKLIKDTQTYKKMAKVNNPYGDGRAAEKIVNILVELNTKDLTAIKNN
jgi:UDP-N-acetylglucosamine 2-epimerase (non-hydrolysing)